MNNIKRSFYEKYKEIMVSFTGPLVKSEFQETGKITPKEFLEAGNTLVQKFPSWEWCQNKKYLKLSGAISKNRPQYNLNIEINDEWETVLSENTTKNIEEIDLDNCDDFIVKHINEKLRIYDLTVIYDEYYSTPRLYLIGYNKDSTLLTKEEMYEDVYLTNREKTVTIDIHPFLKIQSISIHPCRHAETMKRILSHMEENILCEQKTTVVFPPSLCMFIFLKFMSTVIPTIEYDVSIGLDF